MPFPNKATQFKPGQTGNPKGYSRSRRITDALIKLIEDQDMCGQLAGVWLGLAASGDPKFFGMLLERVEGKVPDAFSDPTDSDAAAIREFLDATRQIKAKTKRRPYRRKPKPSADGDRSSG